MKNKKTNITLSLLALSVPCGLMTQNAKAQEETSPANKIVSKEVDVGATGITKKSFKFGEYNGQNQSTLNLGFRVLGGDAFAGGDGTTSFEVKASDLGNTSRSLDAEYGKQGKWKVNFGVDELRHNISDSYQTPQQGDMGGNNFSLPTDFGTISGASAGSAGPTPIGTNALSAAQTNDIAQRDVHTTRMNAKFGLEYELLKNLKLNVDYNHLDQTGAKLIAIGSQSIALGGGSTSLKEGVNVLMNPTKYKNDTVTLDLNYVLENGQINGGYYGSFFKDAYNSVTYQTNISTAACTVGTPGSCFATDVFGTAPSNTLHQFNLNGSYRLPLNTKITGGLSYGINTQDASYGGLTSTQPSGTVFTYMTTLPKNSLDGKVNTVHGDLKVTNQYFEKLNLSAGMKYNERVNKTSSDTYVFTDIGGTAQTLTNTPYSNRKIQYELAGDYRITSAQSARVTLEREDIKRWCENDSIPGGLGCVTVPKTAENKASVNYKINATEDLKVNAGYAYANRTSVVDTTAKTTIDQSGAMTSLGNAYDAIGFVAIPYANRTRQIVKSGATWQATEKMDLGINGSYTRDFYHNLFGVRNGFADSINLDANYAVSDNITVGAFASAQLGERNLNNVASNNSATGSNNLYKVWTNNLKDVSNAIGINGEIKGLMGGKMDINSEVTYTLDKTDATTAMFYGPASSTIAGPCTQANILACGSTPTIKTQIITFKIGDTYVINKNSKIAVGYIFQNMKSDDYYYNVYQAGNTAGRSTDPTIKNKGTMLPTNEQAPNYTENMITATYIYNF